jgi:hypothetical protein
MTEEAARQADYYQWGPGDILPENNMYCEIRDLFQKMESKIDSTFLEFNTKLENFDTRLTLMEQNPTPSSTNTCSETISDGRKRKRRSPSELQVCTVNHIW